ncbi:hypothetical protein GEMRC1_013635 [Eukaryota sp. GEM-RC1]
MEFNFLGECAMCPLNYYSNLEFNSECRSCYVPRITLQKGSSDLDHCVCPLNTLDSVDSCLPCPHLAECGYGNLTGIEPGFRLNTDTWELDECVFWFNCQDNSCRSRHAYGELCQYCSNDVVSKRVYCIGKEQVWLKVLSFICFVVVLFVADLIFVLLAANNSKFKYLRLATLSLSSYGRQRVFNQYSHYSNILNIILFVLPTIFFYRISIWVVTIQFMASLIYFDSSLILFVLIVGSLSMVSKLMLSKYFKLSNFNLGNSAFVFAAAMCSINFLFGTILSHVFIESQSIWQLVLLFFHLSFLIFVIVLQRQSPYFLSLICYSLVVFGSLFPSLFYYIIQNLVLVLLISFSTDPIEVILIGASLILGIYSTLSFYEL